MSNHNPQPERAYSRLAESRRREIISRNYLSEARKHVEDCEHRATESTFVLLQAEHANKTALTDRDRAEMVALAARSNDLARGLARLARSLERRLEQANDDLLVVVA